MTEMYDTVLERLTRWTHEQPDKKIWTFLDDHGDFVEDYSYAVSYHFFYISRCSCKIDKLLL
jgi:hypothetical protein